MSRGRRLGRAARGPVLLASPGTAVSQRHDGAAAINANGMPHLSDLPPLHAPTCPTSHAAWQSVTATGSEMCFQAGLPRVARYGQYVLLGGTVRYGIRTMGGVYGGVYGYIPSSSHKKLIYDSEPMLDEMDGPPLQPSEPSSEARSMASTSASSSFRC
eukprot:359517-Chlamydomonas_euryale.AAC.1